MNLFEAIEKIRGKNLAIARPRFEANGGCFILEGESLVALYKDHKERWRRNGDPDLTAKEVLADTWELIPREAGSMFCPDCTVEVKVPEETQGSYDKPNLLEDDGIVKEGGPLIVWLIQREDGYFATTTRRDEKSANWSWYHTAALATQFVSEEKALRFARLNEARILRATPMPNRSYDKPNLLEELPSAPIDKPKRSFFVQRKRDGFYLKLELFSVLETRLRWGLAGDATVFDCAKDAFACINDMAEYGAMSREGLVVSSMEPT